MNDRGNLRIPFDNEISHPRAMKVAACELRGWRQFRSDSGMSGREISSLNSREQEPGALCELLDRHAVAFVVILVCHIACCGAEQRVPPKRPGKMHAEAQTVGTGHGVDEPANPVRFHPGELAVVAAIRVDL